MHYFSQSPGLRGISQMLVLVPCMTSASTISAQVARMFYLWNSSRIGTIVSKRFYSRLSLIILASLECPKMPLNRLARFCTKVSQSCAMLVLTCAPLVPGLYCAVQARSLVKDYTATDFVQPTMLTLAPARLWIPAQWPDNPFTNWCYRL